VESQIQYSLDLPNGIMMRFHRIFSIFIFTALTVACSKDPAIEAEHTDAAMPATNAESGIIRFGMSSYIASGLPNNIPSFAVVVDGNVQAVRAGFEEVVDTLAAIAKGEQILDEDEIRQEMQTAMEKFLASQQMTPDSLTAENKNIILLFSPDEGAGECPPCTQAFGSLQEGSLIGEFTIIKALIGNR